EAELIAILQKYGEEEEAQPIAREIIIQRAKQPIQTTYQLSELVTRIKRKKGKIHPATQTFQALRMYVNGEMEALEKGLKGSISLLANNGRLVVISFHSLEDRMVKRIFQDWERQGVGTVITKKPIVATDKEQSQNTRSRSAKLRVIEKNE